MDYAENINKIIVQEVTKEENLQKIRHTLKTMSIPANMMIDKKVTTTISVPQELNKKIDDLSRELGMTKSLLLLLGFLFFLYVIMKD